MSCWMILHIRNVFQNWQDICNGSNQVFQESYFTYKNGTKFLTRKGEIPVA